MNNIRGKRSKLMIIDDFCLLPIKDRRILSSIANRTAPKEAIRLYNIYCRTKKFRIKHKLWNRIRKEYDKRYVVMGIDLTKENSDFSCLSYMRKINGKWIVEEYRKIKERNDNG